jgi:5,10-methylenetetrahydrofolate reductase
VSFRLIYELEPPRVPDLKKVRTQIEIFGPIVDAILIPDNHLGQPAMSSVPLALEVRSHGFKPIVALNARDRNHLRLASELITLRAYEIEEVLFLYGDPIDEGRSSLNVKQMLAHEAGDGLKKGVAAVVGKRLGWRSNADFLFTQLAFGSVDAGAWRAREGFNHPVFCGVIGMKDAEIASKFADRIPELAPPMSYFKAFERDPDAGFVSALSELDSLADSGIEGAHLVVPAGWRRFSEMLEDWATSRRDS